MKFWSAVLFTIVLLATVASALPAGSSSAAIANGRRDKVSRQTITDDTYHIQKRQGPAMAVEAAVPIAGKVIGGIKKAGKAVGKVLGKIFHHHHKKPAQAAANAPAPNNNQ